MPYHGDADVLGDFYGKTSSGVYYKGKLIPAADPKTFEVLGGSGVLSCEGAEGGYAKDRDRVYFSGGVIQGADASTFHLYMELGIARDQRYEYRKGVKVPNELVRCSADPADLPGGWNVWSTKLPSSVLATSTSSFEFCITPNQEMIVGYASEAYASSKTFELFDQKQTKLRNMKFDCSDVGTVFPMSLRALDGSTLTLTCLAGDACSSRAFYELNLDRWRTAGDASVRKTTESYDCGYRG
jgi:hypothetical protein